MMTSKAIPSGPTMLSCGKLIVDRTAKWRRACLRWDRARDDLKLLRLYDRFCHGATSQLPRRSALVTAIWRGHRTFAHNKGGESRSKTSLKIGFANRKIGAQGTDGGDLDSNSWCPGQRRCRRGAPHRPGARLPGGILKSAPLEAHGLSSSSSGRHHSPAKRLTG